MKKQINPVLAITLIVILVSGAVFIAVKSMTGNSASGPVIVKPANPDDPKFKADPKLGLGGT